MLNRVRRGLFRLLYNELACTYDFVSRAVSLGRWRTWQRSVIQYLPAPEDGLVLELAHGTGDLQLDLTSAGYRTVALDRSRSMGRLARRKLSPGNTAVLLVRGDALRLPLPSNSISAAVCAFPTSFILQTQTLNELRRVLKPGAKAVVLLSGMLTGGGLTTKVIGGLYRLTGQSYARFEDEALRRQFQAPGLAAEARVLKLDDSEMQIVLLKKRSATPRNQGNHSLDLLAEA